MGETEDFSKQEGNQEKPSAEEIFYGKDVVLGKEIVEMLLAEEVCVPVYRLQDENKKIRFLIDREVGEVGKEDFTVRQQQEEQRELLGVVVPTVDSENEFIFLGIREDSFVFTAGKEIVNNYKPDKASSFTFKWDRFGDFVNSEMGIGDEYEHKVSFREHDNSQKFTNMVVAAVEFRRKLQKTVRKAREEVRRDLKDRLYKS